MTAIKKFTTTLFVIIVIAVGVGLAMPTPWWKSAQRDEGPHSVKVTFIGGWSVFSHDRGTKLRSDSATVSWHAGEASYNKVNHGGKFSDFTVLGPGTHLVTFRIEVDTATETTCKMMIGKSTYPGNKPERSATGVCALSTTVHVP